MNSNTNTTVSQTHLDHIKSHVCTVRCMSWTAVIAGAIIALGFSFLLNLLGLAIGLSAYPTTTDGQTALAVGGFVGLVIFAILAMFPAGYVAGRLGRAHCINRKMGELYGLVAWGLALILTILLASSIGQFVSQSSYLVNRQAINIRVMDMNNDAVKVNKTPNGEPTSVQVDPEKAAQATALATFATFFIFFIGMLAACFGGRCGMLCKKGSMMNDPNCQHCQPTTTMMNR